MLVRSQSVVYFYGAVKKTPFIHARLNPMIPLVHTNALSYQSLLTLGLCLKFAAFLFLTQQPLETVVLLHYFSHHYIAFYCRVRVLTSIYPIMSYILFALNNMSWGFLRISVKTEDRPP